MTGREALYEYRLNQAEVTLDSAEDFINEIKRFIDSAELSGINS